MSHDLLVQMAYWPSLFVQDGRILAKFFSAFEEPKGKLNKNTKKNVHRFSHRILTRSSWCHYQCYCVTNTIYWRKQNNWQYKALIPTCISLNSTSLHIWLTLTFSRNTSLLVNLLTAIKESCTIPMTGLFDWGVTTFLGTIMISVISARASKDCGTCKFISSPSKSALYGVVTLKCNIITKKVSQGTTLISACRAYFYLLLWHKLTTFKSLNLFTSQPLNQIFIPCTACDITRFQKSYTTFTSNLCRERRSFRTNPNKHDS